LTTAEPLTGKLVASSRQNREKVVVLTILLIGSGPPESGLARFHWALAGAAEAWQA